VKDIEQLPDDLNPEVVKATAVFIGKITGLVPPPHNAFPPEWYGYLRTFTDRLYEIAAQNAQVESVAFTRLISQWPWERGGDDAMTPKELELFRHTIEQFEDCNETDTPYESLMRWANMGLLECEHFTVATSGRALLTP
jgi:hypothetical protein